MLAPNSYARRGRSVVGSSTAAPTTGSSGTFLVRPRLPLRSYLRPKTTANVPSYDSTGYGRSKRFKSRKLNGLQKMDPSKKKSPDYTEMAYREAVSKLKYLLAESYTPRMAPRKLLHGGGTYRDSNPKINIESEDTDDRSIISDGSHTRGLIGNLPPRSSPYLPRPKNSQLSKACSNLALSAGDPQSAPPELMSFIERQEDYIEQLERESQYCRDELSGLLGKVREVVAENESLQDKSKNGFLKSVIEEFNNSEEENQEPNEPSSRSNTLESKGKRVKLQRVLEGPSIVFESRISELEAQLTQARVELRKAQEENQANLRRLSENNIADGSPEMKAHLDRAIRDKREVEMKLEELQRSFSAARDREADTAHKAKRALDIVEQSQFEKTQSEAEIRRLKDELERQHEKLREAAQDTSRRVAEERHQIERRYSQQIEQLSADVASHWDAASKSQLESEKQRREMADLRRDLAQKTALIDELKKELQSKISSIQSDLSQAVAERDAAEQEVSAAKLSAERTERQGRQEQSRLQAEINSYKQRLERADADLVHCRRENLRLSEQIASLEKEISMNKMIRDEESRTPGATPRPENDKELTSMIMDIETKHAATVAGLEDALANQATLVSHLNAECQSLTQRLEANSLKYKEEMASLQSNIENLSTKIQDTFDNRKSIEPAKQSKHATETISYETDPRNRVPEIQQIQPSTELNAQNKQTKDIPHEKADDHFQNPEKDLYPRNNDPDQKQNEEQLNAQPEQNQDSHSEQQYPQQTAQEQNYYPEMSEGQNVQSNEPYESEHPEQYDIQSSEQYDPKNQEPYDQQAIEQIEGVANQEIYDPQNTEPYHADNYPMDNQHYEADYANQEYNQYDQYDPNQYAQEQYAEGGQYEGQEPYQEPQYNEQEYEPYPSGHEDAQHAGESGNMGNPQTEEITPNEPPVPAVDPVTN